MVLLQNSFSLRYSNFNFKTFDFALTNTARRRIKKSKQSFNINFFFFGSTKTKLKIDAGKTPRSHLFREDLRENESFSKTILACLSGAEVG